jgi:hypothetical protein
MLVCLFGEINKMANMKKVEEITLILEFVRTVECQSEALSDAQMVLLNVYWDYLNNELRTVSGELEECLVLLEFLRGAFTKQTRRIQKIGEFAEGD